MKTIVVLTTLAITAVPWFCCERAGAQEDNRNRPNVVLIMTDDQGYGDMSCHGHPWLKTPNLDKLHAESVRLTDYHASPLCSPTRASLMTGRHCKHVGVRGTTNAANLISRETPTAASGPGRWSLNCQR